MKQDVFLERVGNTVEAYFKAQPSDVLREILEGQVSAEAEAAVALFGGDKADVFFEPVDSSREPVADADLFIAYRVHVANFSMLRHLVVKAPLASQKEVAAPKVSKKVTVAPVAQPLVASGPDASLPGVSKESKVAEPENA